MVCSRAAVVALFLSLTIAAASHAEGDPKAGEALAANCMGCHGVKGYFNVYPTYRVPKLGGQHPDYIVIALKAYRDGQRDHETMHAQAAQLSDEEMLDIAAYLSEFGKEEQ